MHKIPKYAQMEESTVNDQERDYKSIRDMRRALEGIESPQDAENPIMESEAGDTREEAAGTWEFRIFQAMKHNEYTGAPDRTDSRIDEEGNLHITVTLNAGTWENG